MPQTHTLAYRITRLPRAFDADLGQDAANAVPQLSGDMAELVRGAGGSSSFLKSLVEKEGAWFVEAAEDTAAALQRMSADLHELAPDVVPKGLRQAKRRVALLTAMADLSGAWSLETVTGTLTDFADLALTVAIRAQVGELVRRGKLPGQTVDDVATGAGLVMLAMGKMGAHELNYSSDIDLISLFDETRYDPDDFQEARQAMVRITRSVSAMLSDRTSDGYVFRTDLRLRPDPSVTPVCLSFAAAEQYYESLGRGWERAAYVKARPAAGDLAAGDRFLENIRPFIWRRHLDFAAIEDAHRMLQRIRESKRSHGPISIPGHDIKLGRGGIREIEFFTQTGQLIAGGRDPELRIRATVPALRALASKGWIPIETAGRLGIHYRALRDVEHRIQMVHDAQTHTMPKSPEEIERIACLMGTDVPALVKDLHHRLTEVHGLTEDFFAPDLVPPAAAELPDFEFDEEILRRWSTYPAFRTERAVRIFERIKPDLLTRLSRTAKKEEALIALDRFLAGLPAGVQIFSMFEANPQLIDLLVDIVGTSPALAGYLANNSAVFDGVIGGDFFSDWPGCDRLVAGLQDMLLREADYEAQLDAVRGWSREWRFRVGVHFLRGLIDANTAGEQYADLADATIRALVPVVTDQFAIRHGPPPGRGAAILGMGSLGARQLASTSDLDLIVVYDPAEADSSDGPKPLAPRTYYARWTQALITALTAPMARGRLYEVDMRLRPSGSQGPVATSWPSFRHYQENDAWTWEHLALTRARVIAGDPGLAIDVEDFRTRILSRKREVRTVLDEVRDMRARIAQARGPGGLLDLKTGPGRLQDIELIAQAGTLLAGLPDRDVPAGLRAAEAAGWMPTATRERLTVSFNLFWAVRMAMRLISDVPLTADELGEGGAAFLTRSTGFESMEELEQALQDRYDAVADAIEAIVGEGAPA
ncbi:bifunctional [glutamate--ammonia ligase]-adenylyl-L-tyrosine phosphorylase/[glutamate--ammonia-ligase] adenylyltransferase [Chachezhania sediminis]|uniref:bifunctional [glutamate--ammonia ligase]-adenylyl-L-tyrosine phosphorylase/[glutamate--ammonia-ligase] adenylyltransferase n=1 Tax=Chachezhania sediminis TaxID=2599291 RepID=UPI00131D399A|nr:bifunctional [glutamate--ammonia ligase]-adenylyl-L-tyrosine phosphorylase/[glutamate--ammonia-ligase] adenylyltransferase [Chachezhania sediminis]